VPDCDLNNFGLNGECGALDNPNFGSVIPTRTYDPDLMKGWGKRSFNWEFTTSVQQEIIPRMSIEVQYARRWYGNIRVMDDLNVTPANYTPVTLNAPADSRLPNGGGYSVTGMAISPLAAGPSYFITLSNNFGKQTEHFDGSQHDLQRAPAERCPRAGRLRHGRQVTNDCEVVDKLPEMLHSFSETRRDCSSLPPARATSASRTTGGARRSRVWLRTRSRRSMCRSAAPSRISPGPSCRPTPTTA
jgi:hypothetical protein